MTRHLLALLLLLFPLRAMAEPWVEKRPGIWSPTPDGWQAFLSASVGLSRGMIPIEPQSGNGVGLRAEAGVLALPHLRAGLDLLPWPAHNGGSPSSASPPFAGHLTMYWVGVSPTGGVEAGVFWGRRWLGLVDDSYGDLPVVFGRRVWPGWELGGVIRHGSYRLGEYRWEGAWGFEGLRCEPDARECPFVPFVEGRLRSPWGSAVELRGSAIYSRLSLVFEWGALSPHFGRKRTN